jgi:O-antigen ligase
MCCLPFVLPQHQLPIQSFQSEALAAALGITAAIAALCQWAMACTSAPRPALWLLGFAALLASLTVFGAPLYPQLPLAGALYGVFAALMLWLGAQLATRLGIEETVTVLAAAILAGALVNAAAGIIQFYGRPAMLEDFVATMRGNRAYGNIAQANLYVHYLSLGCVCALFLWLRGRLHTAYAIVAATLLAGAIALASTRGAILYVLWIATLGIVTARLRAQSDSKRLAAAACALTALVIAANFVLPWLNNALQIGPASSGAFERLLTTDPVLAEPRWHIWPLAWKVFTEHPLLGVGFGEFAGTAFEQGLPPEVTLHGEIWTSAHNFPLQLLAETGALGAVLALTALGSWWWRAGARYFSSPHPALWWVIAISGIGTIHAMLEFPWWNAHFLGLSALAMGVGLSRQPAAAIPKRATGLALGGMSVALALFLALLVRDYTRLGSTRISGTPSALAASREDVATLEELATGPLAPIAELWIVLGASLDKTQLPVKLARSARVIRYWPSSAVVARRVVFLAFSGESSEARRLLGMLLESFPRRHDETVRILSSALSNDETAIRPLLELAQNAGQGRSTPH